MGDESGGSSSPFSLPTGTVTFLLTDIESSSRKWETDSGAMGPAVARHYEIVGDVVTRWEECARSSRVRATRSSPRSREHRTRSRRRSRRSGTSPTNSVSTSQSGSPCTPATRQLHDEGNYFGNTVIRCARLHLRTRWPGSRVTHNRGSRRRPFARRAPSLLDLGTHRLKDLHRPERVFELSHPELRRSGGFLPCGRWTHCGTTCRCS